MQLSDILLDGTKAHMLTGKVDQVLMAVYFQMGLVTSTHLADETMPLEQVSKSYQSIVALLLAVGDTIGRACTCARSWSATTGSFARRARTRSRAS